MQAIDRQALLDAISTDFDDCLATVTRKNQDYASEADAFSNFTLAGTLCQFFAERGGDETTLGIVTLIGVKLARLAELQQKQAQYESRDDSGRDLVNYAEFLRIHLRGDNG